MLRYRFFLKKPRQKCRKLHENRVKIVKCLRTMLNSVEICNKNSKYLRENQGKIQTTITNGFAQIHFNTKMYKVDIVVCK